MVLRKVMKETTVMGVWKVILRLGHLFEACLWSHKSGHKCFR
ncbi:unnamed protein product [Brassica oleracea]